MTGEPGFDSTGADDPTGELVSQTPSDETVVTSTEDVLPMKKSSGKKTKKTNKTALKPGGGLVSASVTVFRGGGWPGDYQLRVGKEPVRFFPDKDGLLEALGDALPD